MAFHKPRFRSYTVDDAEPAITSVLESDVTLSGATVYVVEDGGIARGKLLFTDGKQVAYRRSDKPNERRAHQNRVYLFRQPAERHFRRIAEHADWGPRGFAAG